MDVILKRVEFRPDGIFSELLDTNGQQIAVSIEHAYSVDSETWEPKIPQGTYICKRRLSPHFGFEVFELMNVPNCDYIEIHPGNFDRDSEGCICVGEKIAEYGSCEMITNSKATFEKFMNLQSGVDQFNLTVI